MVFRQAFRRFLINSKVPQGGASFCFRDFHHKPGSRQALKRYDPLVSDAGAFINCTALKTVVLPSSLRELNSSFMNCSALETLTIPEGVTTLKNGVVFNCDSLKVLIVNAPVKATDALAWYCDSLETVVLGNGSTVLGQNAFNSCPAIKTLVVPESVTKIESASLPAAFYFVSDSNLETIRSALSSRVPADRFVSYLYSEIQPASAGYWHYDENGLPVLWE